MSINKQPITWRQRMVVISMFDTIKPYIKCAECIVISVVRAFAHGAMGHELSYFSFQPVLHDWWNKRPCMCYPVCGLVHIK